MGLPEILARTAPATLAFRVDRLPTRTEQVGATQLLSPAVSWAMALKAAVELVPTIVKNWTAMVKDWRVKDSLQGSTFKVAVFVVTMFFGLSEVFVVGVPCDHRCGHAARFLCVPV